MLRQADPAAVYVLFYLLIRGMLWIDDSFFLQSDADDLICRDDPPASFDLSFFPQKTAEHDSEIGNQYRDIL